MMVSAFKRNQLAPFLKSTDNKVVTNTAECLCHLFAARVLCFVASLCIPDSFYCGLNLQREAGLYYFNKLSCMRRAAVRVGCTFPPPFLPHPPPLVFPPAFSLFSSVH